jgi:hypothetical protein
VNAAKTGTKAAAHYHAPVPAGGTLVARAILQPATGALGFDEFTATIGTRRRMRSSRPSLPPECPWSA